MDTTQLIPVEHVSYKTMAGDPTEETYGDWNNAFHVFNRELFGGRLPPALITLRARGRTNGYYCGQRFIHPDGRITCEIALNPDRFGTRTFEACLSTLTHEMVHMEQDLFGTKSRPGYHNAQFQQWMERVGLVTSNTGRPGGNSVGQQMTHYISATGPFLSVARTLLDGQFKARWADRLVGIRAPEYIDGVSVIEPGGVFSVLTGEPEPTEQAQLQSGVEVAVIAAGAGIERSASPSGTTLMAYPGGEPPLVATKSDQFISSATMTASNASKSKFQCPKCRAAAWGKRSLKLLCVPCNLPMDLVVLPKKVLAGSDGKSEMQIPS